MNKKTIINLLNENKEFIYKISCILGDEEQSNLYNNIIKNSYKNMWKLNESTNYIERIALYSAVEIIGTEKLKEKLKSIDINTDSSTDTEQEVYELMLNNMEKILASKDIEINEELNIEPYFKKYTKRRSSIMLSVVLILIFIITTGVFTLVPHFAYELTPFGNVFNNIHNKFFNDHLLEVDTEVFISDVDMPKDKEETIDFVHHMANTLIIAKNNNAKYGLKEVNPTNIEIAIAAVDEHMKDDELLKLLDRWREGDFYNATIVHNYVWSMLNGEVGYAIAIDQGKVEQVEKQYYK